MMQKGEVGVCCNRKCSRQREKDKKFRCVKNKKRIDFIDIQRGKRHQDWATVEVEEKIKD